MDTPDIDGYYNPTKVYADPDIQEAGLWECTHMETEQPCVIKLFRPNKLNQPEVKREFEMIECLRLLNPFPKNLVQPFEIIRDPKHGKYYTMESCTTNVRKVLHSFYEVGNYPPTAEWVIKVITDVLQGLVELHKFGWFHRDIKPDNTFVKGGVFKVGDYGLVKAIRTGSSVTTAGTPDYMPPESDKYPGLIKDKSRHNWATWDIYSTGVMFAELLTGECVNYNHGKQSSYDRFPKQLWTVIKKAIQYNPEDRYQTAEEFLKAVKSIKL
ncbi:MAG: serine/threonine-protein kinase [Planctomycetota bacterium]|nr:serine/threonine-protein kinase [Planctomycetota bacterium]MDI6787663.1 serine/threonine-protein kinase [Planctomycetota bacterium]